MRRIVTALAFASYAAGCSPEPHAVVTVRDPRLLASDAQALAVGFSLDALNAEAIGPNALPTTLVLTGRTGPTTVWVEARRAGDVLARGRVEVVFDRSSRSSTNVDLANACEADVPNGESCLTDASPPVDGVCVANQCLESRCGDGIVDRDRGEKCDDANSDDSDGCLSNCERASCGDGVLRVAVEVCDDNNNVSGDGCRADCLKIERCGDGILDAGEQCDDGNENPNDGCSNSSAPIACAEVNWTSELVFGLGLSAGSPTNVRLSNVVDVALGNDSDITLVEESGRIFTLRDDVLFADSVAAFRGFGSQEVVTLGPAGVAIDSFGALYLSDPGQSRVVSRLNRGSPFAQIAGTGVQGQPEDGLAVAVPLNRPTAVTIDGLGSLFVADSAAHMVVKIDTDGVLTRFVGTGEPGDALEADSGLNTQLNSPSGVAVGYDGAVYVSDTGNDRVLRISSQLDPERVRLMADSDDGVVRPTDITMNGGDVFVVLSDETISRVQADGTVVPFAGGGSTAVDESERDGLTLNLGEVSGLASLYDGDEILLTRNQSPALISIDISTARGRAIAGDAGLGVLLGATQTGTNPGAVGGWVELDNGSVWIALPDFHQIIEVNAEGQLRVVAGTGAAGNMDGPSATATFETPVALARDGSTVFVLEQDPGRVRTIDAEGLVSTFIGSNAGVASRQLALLSPCDIVIDDGSLLVSESGAHQISAVALNTDGPPEVIVGTGVPGYSGDGGSPSAAQLHSPCGLALDRDGALLVADRNNHAIRRVDLDSAQVSTIVGGREGELIDPTDPLNTELRNPEDIWDDHSTLWISDPGNRRVLQVGEATIAALDGPRRSDGQPPELLGFTSPARIQALGDTVAVADADRLRQLVDGSLQTWLGEVDPPTYGPQSTAKLGGAFGLAAIDGAVWLTDTEAGRVASFEDSVLSPIAGYATTIRQINGTSARLSRLLQNPTGIATIADRVFIAESRSNSILVLDEQSSEYTLSSFAGRAPRASCCARDGFPTCTVVENADMFCVDTEIAHRDGFLYQARFSNPTGLASDGINRLFVADTSNNVIREIDLANSRTTTLAGEPGRAGNRDGSTRDASFNQPVALAYRNGFLFVADRLNHRVRRISIEDETVETILGDGIAASSGEGLPSRSFPVNSPAGLAFDLYGNLLVSSRDSVRMVTSGADGIVSGEDEVKTIYRSDTAALALPTECLAGVIAEPGTGDSFLAVDTCVGALVRISRVLRKDDDG